MEDVESKGFLSEGGSKVGHSVCESVHAMVKPEGRMRFEGRARGFFGGI